MSLTDLQRKKILYAFHLWDANGDGVIEQIDFEQYSDNVAGLLKLEPTSEGAKAIKAHFQGLFERQLQASDTDKDGKISEKEFLDHYAKDYVIPNNIEAIMKTATEIFTFVDRNRDGEIDLQEYIFFLAAWRVPEENAKKAFSILTENSGKLSFEKFLHYCKEFWLSDDPNSIGNNFFGILDK
eukprot:TRINITY_DN814_c0_g3_i2.p1 TRINITY_DN814_c0_g3~~TRINITY_DN814_c0_g3_i2.p1  ORF type:complete len:183 (+),score=30.27 TRINITY_DN814_c0_g3_i2:106-654(+)